MAEKDYTKDLFEGMSDETFQNGSEKELIKHVYMQILQSQILETKLLSDVMKLKEEVKFLRKQLSRNQFIPSYWNHLRYDSRLKQITVNDEFKIDFRDSEMTDLLGLMFYKTNKKPKPSKWQTSDIAKRFNNKQIVGLSKANDVYKVAHRINKRLQDETGIKFLEIKTKEFYWFHTN